MENSITITYETIFELLRREKDRLELQKLDPGFLNQLTTYMMEKNSFINDKQHELFSEDEKVNTVKQISNLKKIIRELYERREKKIAAMAMDKSRTKSDLMDTSAMLESEKSLFDSLVKTLDEGRENILHRLLAAEMPKQKEAPKQEKDTRLIRFKHSVPKFVGLEGEELGPFEEEDIASLSREIADVLINKGRAEEINES